MLAHDYSLGVQRLGFKKWKLLMQNGALLYKVRVNHKDMEKLMEPEISF